MDARSESDPTKRPRTKAAAAAPKTSRKTLTARKKTPEVLEMTPDAPTDLTGMIATAAFYLAADRNFAPGHELDDWLEAERRIRGIP